MVKLSMLHVSVCSTATNHWTCIFLYCGYWTLNIYILLLLLFRWCPQHSVNSNTIVCINIKLLLLSNSLESTDYVCAIAFSNHTIQKWLSYLCYTLVCVVQGWGQVQYLYLVLVLKYIFISTCCTWVLGVWKCQSTCTCTWPKSTWYLQVIFKYYLLKSVKIANYLNTLL